VTEAKLAGESVATGKIKLLAITAGLLAAEAVTEGKIANLAVTAGKIANLAVETGKIKDLAVTSAKLAELCVTTAKIEDDAVTDAKIAKPIIVAQVTAAGVVEDAAKAGITVEKPGTGEYIVNLKTITVNNSICIACLSSNTANGFIRSSLQSKEKFTIKTETNASVLADRNFGVFIKEI
jgi:hypothetical protein